jgi:hypothetical protein
MELVMAAVIALFAGVIIAGSLQLDTGWVPETGPQAGYLPLRLGIGLAVISVLIFLQMLRNPEGGGFVTGGQLKSTLAIFLPTVVLVAAMPWLGCYVPSWLYLCYMIKAHGGTGIGKSVLVSSLIIIAFYLVFDLWFQVDLAKGPVESFLGL